MAEKNDRYCYDEAYEKIWGILFPYATVKTQPKHEMITQILNLKSEGWRIAILKDNELDESRLIDNEKG